MNISVEWLQMRNIPETLASADAVTPALLIEAVKYHPCWQTQTPGTSRHITILPMAGGYLQNAQMPPHHLRFFNMLYPNILI